jgi:hypothetical protein
VGCEVGTGLQGPGSSPFNSGQVIFGLTGAFRILSSCLLLDFLWQRTDCLLHTAEEKAVSSLLEEAAEEVGTGDRNWKASSKYKDILSRVERRALWALRTNPDLTIHAM